MLSDRTYMRNVSAGPRRIPFLGWMLGGLAAVFLAQSVSATWFQDSTILEWGQLSAKNMRAGRWWTLLTYATLHGFLLHFLVNAAGLFFFGRRLEERYSSARLGLLTLASALGGSLLWLLFHHDDVGGVAGASGVAAGFVAIFVWIDPRERLAFVPVKRYWLLVLLVGTDLAGLLFRELPLGLARAPVSHSAHLGGVIGGSLFFLVERVLPRLRRRKTVEPPSWQSRRAARPEPAYTVNVRSATPEPAARVAPSAATVNPPATPRPQTRPEPFPGGAEAFAAEVDRVLDKINAGGLAALEPAERAVLDEAHRRRVAGHGAR